MSMSGVEGRLKKNTAAEQKVTSWKLQTDPNLGEDTNGTTGGIQTANAIKLKHTVNFELLLDAGATIESIGLGPGVTVALDLRRGTSATGIMNWSGIISAVETTGMDPNGFVKAAGTWQALVAKPAESTYS